ncbi:hypothetical protein JX265_006030 [Neoarthrinium moseri]|uniref:Uncharacterized protein n=1 Tax=Neoarthrinium moseri TaxID=1658444 RepID=A0A9Q0AQR5_9PEZI|nr:hypothetical protein JX266_000492 [Neoarthrinium moseri]KAI1870990.1 hypothetical protein JX265_006030 [Neoarthrinium moseri]
MLGELGPIGRISDETSSWIVGLALAGLVSAKPDSSVGPAAGHIRQCIMPTTHFAGIGPWLGRASALAVDRLAAAATTQTLSLPLGLAHLRPLDAPGILGR